MSLFLNLLLMSKKAWPLKKIFLREVSKLLKCYVLVKKFYRKSATSLKTLQIGFVNAFLWLNQSFGVLPSPLNLSYLAIRIFYLDYSETTVLSCTFAIKCMLFSEIARCTKDDIMNILRVYRIRSNIWTGKGKKQFLFIL